MNDNRVSHANPSSVAVHPSLCVVYHSIFASLCAIENRVCRYFTFFGSLLLCLVLFCAEFAPISLEILLKCSNVTLLCSVSFCFVGLCSFYPYVGAVRL